MNNKYNLMYFSSEDIKNKLHTKLIETLFELSLKSDNEIVHIHTYTEEDAIIVEWCQHNPEFDDYDKNTFSYVGEEECVMFEGQLPDRHYEYFHSEEEYKEVINDWLKEHPNYKQNQYGHWYDEDEYKSVQETSHKAEKGVTNNE